MPKPKPLTPTSIKFTDDEKRFLKITARAQGHYNVSRVIKQYVREKMTAA